MGSLQSLTQSAQVITNKWFLHAPAPGMGTVGQRYQVEQLQPPINFRQNLCPEDGDHNDHRDQLRPGSACSLRPQRGRQVYSALQNVGKIQKPIWLQRLSYDKGAKSRRGEWSCLQLCDQNPDGDG